MVSKMLCGLVLIMMSVGCISAPQGKSSVTLDDVLAYTSDKLAEVGSAVNAANQHIAAIDVKLEESKATVASVEAIVGPLDTDKDGEISAAEAADFYGRVKTSTNPDAQNPDTQEKVYKALMALMAAQFASRKLGHKLPPSLQWVTAILGSPQQAGKPKDPAS
jgi:hypothetical protein